jgi:DNA-directed RNA polymerase subunit M/transcription elongation factor TFIIS
MSSKTKKEKEKEKPDNEDIRDKTFALIENAIPVDLPIAMEVDIADFSSRIEEGIEANSKNDNGDFSVMLYTILTVKVLENLKNPYVINCIKNETWQPEDLAKLDKDALNPEKWQQLQETRLPKNIKKEMKKGVNKCKRCGSWYTDYTTAQTRSADEASTVFCRCLECEFRWKM